MINNELIKCITVLFNVRLTVKLEGIGLQSITSSSSGHCGSERHIFVNAQYACRRCIAIYWRIAPDHCTRIREIIMH